MARFERLATAERAGGRVLASHEREERREASFFLAFLLLLVVAILVLIWPAVSGGPALQALALIGGGFLLFIILLVLSVMILGRKAYRATVGIGREAFGRRRRR